MHRTVPYRTGTLHACSFAFDPSVNRADGDLAPGVHFRRLGLAESDGVQLTQQDGTGRPLYPAWTMKSLESFMSSLGHTRVDIL